jgi:RNA polymerase sigma-70 factor (ECF subfamily)
MQTREYSDKQKQVSQWVGQYGDDLYTWAFHKTQDQQTAEDLVQDTFLASFQSFEKFQHKSTPRTWLFAILNNKITDHFRQQIKNASTIRERHTLINFFDENGDWKEEAKPLEWSLYDSHLLDDIEFGRVFQDCLRKLPESWNACLQLKYLDEKDGDQVCQVMNITPSNFWQILHRAKLQIRKCLEKNWFTA